MLGSYSSQHILFVIFLHLKIFLSQSLLLFVSSIFYLLIIIFSSQKKGVDDYLYFITSKVNMNNNYIQSMSLTSKPYSMTN